MTQKIRVATYNIHKARGLDGRTRIERIARVLETIGADIVALQEVVSHEGFSIEDHQADYLAQRFGYFHVIGETRKHLRRSLRQRDSEPLGLRAGQARGSERVG